jgi:hypothetical protein
MIILIIPITLVLIMLFYVIFEMAFETEKKTKKKMIKIKAFFIRTFCFCISFYGNDTMEIGDVWWSIQDISYIYVGKNKLWVKKLKTKK